MLAVTTWNLKGSSGVDVDAVADHARAQGSDVLLLQEVQRAQARRIAQALSARSLHWGFKHWPVRTRPEVMAVVGVTVEAPARTRAVTRPAALWSWRRRIVQIGRAGALDVVNVHLTPGGPASDGERAREVGWLVLHVDATGALAVGGDFNAEPGAAMFGGLAGAGLRDAWLVAHPDDAGGGLSNWRGSRQGPPVRRIDGVWVSPEAGVVDATVPVFGEPGFAVFPALSDHLPVTVHLEL